MEALIFTAEGDMRNALNHLQSTFAGLVRVGRGGGGGCRGVCRACAWTAVVARPILTRAPPPPSPVGLVTEDHVYKVCDQPHPLKVRGIVESCACGDVEGAMAGITELWNAGYSSLDLVTTFFKVTKGMDNLPEALKLDFLQHVSATHMRVVDGVGSLLQMYGLASKLVGVAKDAPGGPLRLGGAAGGGAAGGAGGGGRR